MKEKFFGENLRQIEMRSGNRSEGGSYSFFLQNVQNSAEGYDDLIWHSAELQEHRTNL